MDPFGSGSGLGELASSARLIPCGRMRSQDNPGAGLWLIGCVLLVLAPACSRPSSLTAADAERILKGSMFATEPIYAEVPQAVHWSHASPKDDYDALAVKTLANLRDAGLLTLSEATGPDGSYRLEGKTTARGFRELGTVPSARGPAFRGRIAQKRVDGVRNFVRHPSQPTVGRAEVVWHYEMPTSLYGLFETKIDKPLDEPFATLVSIHWENGSWRLRVIAEKVAPSS